MAKKDTNSNGKVLYVWATLRILLGLIFLWAFADKMIGLGYATCYDSKANVINVMCDKAFVNGGSATKGFLTYATKGPLVDFYNGLAGNTAVDMLFMSGLLLIGVALTMGIGVRLAVISGVVLLTMMWSSVLPPANNPVIDEHIVYIAVLVGIYLTNKDQVWGFGKFWQSKSYVKKYKWLA